MVLKWGNIFIWLSEIRTKVTAEKWTSLVPHALVLETYSCSALHTTLIPSQNYAGLGYVYKLSRADKSDQCFCGFVQHIES